MIVQRARANHELYLAKLVIGAWQRERATEAVPAATLAQAFFPGARDHLLAAYGWFLLAISQAEEPPQGLPRCCDELPPMPEGRVYPPEINEFRQLETSGWLREMLQPVVFDMPAARQPGNLAAPAQSGGDCGQAEHWHQQLQRLFERMGDSLDEY